MEYEEIKVTTNNSEYVQLYFPDFIADNSEEKEKS